MRTVRCFRPVRTVALRKESVDRNPREKGLHPTQKPSLSARRAWIEMRVRGYSQFLRRSLSARRAWIEIPAGCWRESRRAVALRKESVDRNQGVHYDNYNLHWSLSARRAWIEIICAHCFMPSKIVALRKESVDRNDFGSGMQTGAPWSLSARRAWIEIPISAHTGTSLSRRSPQGERG